MTVRGRVSAWLIADRSGRQERKKGESETEAWKLGSRLSLLRVLLRFKNKVRYLSEAGLDVDWRWHSPRWSGEAGLACESVRLLEQQQQQQQREG